jgi:DNA-binding CsgD family transcriptional regulator
MLDEAVRQPLTVVRAPAGMGKSTAIAQWAKERDAGSVHWLNPPFDRDGHDLAVALLDAAGYDGRQTDVGSEDGAGTLISLLEESLSQPAVLVIDDADRLPDSAWTVLDDVIDTVPDRVRLVMTTRQPLPLSARDPDHSGSGVLGAEALRFDDNEASALLRVLYPAASRNALDQLADRAGGWVAALVLGRSRTAAADGADGRRPAIVDAALPAELRDEVLAALPPDPRQLLLCIAHEDIVTESAAAVLTGDSRVGDHLHVLAAEGLLLPARAPGPDPAAQGWCLAPVLKDALRALADNEGPDQALIASAHDRAAQHHAVRGSVTQAVRHATIAGSTALLTQLIIEHGLSLLSAGGDDILGAGLDRLGDAAVNASPGLLAMFAMLQRSRGNVEMATNLAQRVIRAAAPTRAELRSRRPDDGSVPSVNDVLLVTDATLLKLYLARFGWADRAQALSEARELIGCSGHLERVHVPADGADRQAHHPKWPLPPFRFTALLLETAGMETWSGDLLAAGIHASEAVATARVLGYDRNISSALGNRAILELIDEKYQTAAATAAECLLVARRGGRTTDSCAPRALVALAWSAYIDVHFGEALRALEELDAHISPASDPCVVTLARILRARLLAEAGDVLGARRLLAGDSTIVEPLPPFLAWMLALARGLLAMMAGDYAEAREQADVMDSAGVRRDGSSIRWMLADRAGDRETAKRVLVNLSGGEPGTPGILAGVVNAYLCRLALLDDQTAQAREHLLNALTELSTQRALYPLVRIATATPGFVPLLEQLVEGPAHPFSMAALSACRRYERPFADRSFAGDDAGSQTVEGGPTPAVDRGEDALLPDPGRVDGPGWPVSLTPRELDVLHELALGSSYADIAGALFITENTVKTHVMSLYRKLGADRRAVALRRAREFGIL